MELELELVKAIAAGGEDMALATVISVKGSAPRHPGAKLLLGARSGQRGTVGGGRGESRALQACRDSLERPACALLQVEMTGTDATGPDMVCGGESTLLIERLLDPAPYRIALERLSRGERVLFVKGVQAAEGGPAAVAVSLLDQVGTLLHGTGAGAGLSAQAARALDGGRACWVEAAGLFYDPVFPEEKLLILGAGHVGQALAARAPALGFAVTVVDDRPEFLAPDRFPPDVATIRAGFKQAIAGFPFDAATYAVILTRGHLLDLECVRAVLGRPYRYAGFMGSARKTRLLIDQVLKDGCDPAKVAALCAPIGLDIAAETPEELAVAILGELVAVRRNARILAGLGRDRAARRA